MNSYLSGASTIGPYAISNIEEIHNDSDYYNASPPGIKIINGGTKQFTLYAITGDFSVSAYGKKITIGNDSPI